MACYQLDTSGLICPMPVIKTQQKIQQLKIGDKLQVTCSDPTTEFDIPSWVKSHQHELLDIKKSTAPRLQLTFHLRKR